MLAVDHGYFLGPTTNLEVPRLPIHQTALIAIAALLLLATAGASSAAASQFTLSGGYSGPLGDYGSVAWVESVTPDARLSYGLTYSDKLGTEVLISLTRLSPLSHGWNLSFMVGRGGLGGDYRVDRVPEITLARTAPLLGPLLSYTLEAGVGNYVVQPVGLTGVRATAAVTLSTAEIPLNPVVSFGANAGYRQYVYRDGDLYGTWWGSAHLSFRLSPSVSVSLKYVRQDPLGASPLLFDVVSADNHVGGSVTIAPVQGLTLGYDQTYSFLAQADSHRAYSVSLTLKPGVVGGFSWEEVGQKASVWLSIPELGSVSVTYEVLTGRVSFGLTR